MKKRMFFTSVFTMTLLAALALVSLFPANESFANGPTYYNLADYWPLTQGSTWTYQETENGETGSYTITIDGFKKVKGVKTAKRVKVEDDQYEEYDFMSFDSGGLKLFKWVEPLEGVYGVPDPPFNPLPAQMYVGQTHNSSFIQKEYNLRGEVIGKAKNTWSVTLEGLDNVTVPAGEFTCLKFSFFESWLGLKGWSGMGTQGGTFWLARGIGEVKWVGTESIYDEYGQLIEVVAGADELTSYGGPNDSTVTRPNGGNVIPSGSTYPIEWTAFPGAASYKLKYSMNNGKTWKPIISEIPDTSHNWPVPIPPKNKTKCLVKVIGYDVLKNKVGADRSDWPFTIAVVKMTWPNGGETLTTGDIPTITWTTHETKKDVARVILKYTKNGGRTWNKIGTLEGNPGNYDGWTVPDVPKVKSKCKVMVVLKDAKGNTVGIDTSDGYFTIAERIEDDFNDGILDSSIWRSVGNVNRYAIETNGRLEIRANGVEDDAAGVQLVERLISVDEDFRVQVDFDSSECSLNSGIILMVHNATDMDKLDDYIFVGNGHDADIVVTRSWLAGKAINDEFVQTMTEPTTSNSGTLYIEHKGNLFYVSFIGYGADNAFATFTIDGWTSCSQVFIGLWGFTRYQVLSGQGSYFDNFELVIGP